MPSINLPLNDVASSVERPVVFDVLRQLMVITGISPKTKIRFYGGEAMSGQFGSYIGQKEPGLNLWPHNENVTIEVDEDFSPEHMLNMQVKGRDTPPVFLDPALRVSLRPAYSTTDVTMRVTYKAQDENQAKRWRNEVRTRIAMGREVNMHTLTYNYALPSVFEALLMHIYELREASAGYGQSFGQWWAQCASPRFTIVTTQVGGSATPVVAGVQAMVQGVFDMDGAPEKPTKDADVGLWSMSFSYKFRYDKPIEMIADYPLAVHQQPIGAKFRQFNNAPIHKKVLQQLSTSGVSLDHFSTNQEMARNLANKGLTLPIIDDWLPAAGTVPNATVKVFTAMCQLKSTDLRTLLNLKQLGDFNLLSDVVTFLEDGEYEYLVGTGTSIFKITVYEGYEVIHFSELEVDSALNVKATRDLDLRKIYHVRFSLYADIMHLQASAVARLLLQPELKLRLVKAINAALTMSGNARGLRKNALNLHDLARLRIDGELPSSYGYSLFQTLFVQSERMENYQPPVTTPVLVERPYVPVPSTPT